MNCAQAARADASRGIREGPAKVSSFKSTTKDDDRVDVDDGDDDNNDHCSDQLQKLRCSQS